MDIEQLLLEGQNRIEKKLDANIDELRIAQATINKEITILQERDKERKKEIDVLFDTHRLCKADLNRKFEPMLMAKAKRSALVWIVGIGSSIILLLGSIGGLMAGIAAWKDVT